MGLPLVRCTPMGKGAPRSLLAVGLLMLVQIQPRAGGFSFSQLAVHRLVATAASTLLSASMNHASRSGNPLITVLVVVAAMLAAFVVATFLIWAQGPIRHFVLGVIGLCVLFVWALRRLPLGVLIAIFLLSK